MKILFLATYFPKPGNPTIGTWALEQAKAFHNAQELDVKVISANPWFPRVAGRLKKGIRAYSECPRKHSWVGVEVDYLPMLFYSFGKLDSIFNRVGEPMLKLGWWSIKRRLMKIVQEFRPDVVYAHHTVPNGYFAFRIHKLTGIPFVVTDHEMGEITACEIFPARRAVYEKVIDAAHRMVSVAGVMRKDMERVFPQARCEVIHNGMNLTGQVETLKENLTTEDTEIIEEEGGSRSASQAGALEPDSLTSQLADSPVSESRTRFASGPAFSPATRNSLPVTAPEAKPLVILSCGMFYGRKNFPGLIQAFNLIANDFPEAVLRICGDGPDSANVLREGNKSPYKNRIELLGKLSHEEVNEQMAIADIFVLIGWREPFGVVYLEAMAAGLPVIACNDGGFADIVENGVNALLVPPRDIQAAAEKLRILLSDPSLRKKVGSTGQEMALTKMTWEAITKKYIQIFKAANNQ